MARYKCGKCQTEYFEPGECDWCPEQTRTLIAEGTCEEQLQRLSKRTAALEVKAAKWDSLPMMAHRMGVAVMDVIKAINARIRG